MSTGDFDPYYKWFGIPPAEQPADHYRLLGVNKFEEDPDVIENAADARMASLQSRKTGAHSLLAEELMNEVTQARICLLHPEKKAAYDGELHEAVLAPIPQAPATTPQPLAAAQPVTPTIRASAPRASGAAAVSRAKKKNPLPLALLLLGGSAVVLLVLAGVAAVMLSGDTKDSGKGLAGADALAEITLDVPPPLRDTVSVQLDGKAVPLPATGPATISCKLGIHTITATRAGHKKISLPSVNITPGVNTLNLNWQRATAIQLNWPVAERSGATLTIDGKPVDLIAAEQTDTSVTLPVEPGPRTLSIQRPSLPPFMQDVNVAVDGVASVTPVWSGTVSSNDPSDKAFVDLLALIDLQRHTWAGNWKRLQDNSLTMQATTLPALVIPYKVPERFRLQLELRRTAGDGKLMISVPSKHGRLRFVVSKDSVSMATDPGIKELIHDLNLEYSGGVQSHTAEISIDGDLCGLKIDGRKLFENHRIDPKKIRLDDRFQHHPGSLPGLCIETGSTYAFDAIRLFAEGDKGQPVEVDTSKVTVFQGHAYQRLPQHLSWREAVKQCEALGGYLCCIETREELDFVLSKLAHDPGVWVGGNDAREEGDWKWINGASFDKDLWPEGQPDNHSEREQYLSVTRKVPGLNDARAAFMAFICEWDSETPTAPDPTATSTVQQLAIAPGAEKARMRFENDGHTYCLIEAPATWYQAEAFCKQLGGYLACVENKAEQKHLEEQLAMMPAGYQVWTGGEIEDSAGKWLNGASFDQSMLNKDSSLPICKVVLERSDPANEMKALNAGHRCNFLCEWDSLNPPGLQTWQGDIQIASGGLQPVPDSEALATAAARIETAFQVKSQSKSRESALAVAANLLNSAETETDKVMRFALLRQAYQLAAGQSAPWMATRATDRLRSQFEFARSVTEQAKMLAFATQKIITHWEPTFALRHADKLVRQAETEEDFAALRALYQHLKRSTRNSKNSALKKSIADAADQIDAYQEITLAAVAADAKLENSPGDIDAATTQAIYHAVVHHDWQTAMPLFALDRNSDLGQASAQLYPVANGPMQRTPTTKIAVGEGFIKLAELQDGPAAQEKAKLLQAAARQWFQASYADGTAAQKQQIAPYIDYKFQELPNGPLALVVNGIAGLSELAPAKVTGTGAVRAKDMFAQINGEVKIDYPVLPTCHFTHVIDLELLAPGGSIKFRHGGHRGTECSVYWKKEENCFICEHRRYEGSHWYYDKRLKLKPGDRLQVELVTKPGHQYMLQEGKRLRARGRDVEDLRMWISATKGSQFAIHRSYVRPITSGDFKNIKYPLSMRTQNTNWADAAVTNHARNLGLAGEPSLENARSFVLPSNGVAFVALEPGGYPWAHKAKNVDVKIPYKFWIARNELSQREWMAVTGTNPSRTTGSPWLPLDGVNRTAAIAYCNALNAKEQSAGRLPKGYIYRLPTEAEWVYAAKANSRSTTPLTEEEVWCMPLSKNLKRDCGVGKANGFGLYDMQGSVSEWVLDAHGKDHPPGDVSPFARPSSKTKEFMLMGGSNWQTFFGAKASSRREWRDIAAYSFGFRPVLAPVR